MNTEQQFFSVFYAVFFGVLISSLPPKSFPTDKLITKVGWKALLRLTLSVIIINLFPALYYIAVYARLDSYSLSNNNEWLAAAKAVILPISALGIFAFNRLYFAALKMAGANAFPHDDDSQASAKNIIQYEVDPWRHFAGSIVPYWIFLALPWIVPD